MADFSPQKFISDGKRLKSGLPIRYSVYTEVRELNLPTFHLKILISDGNRLKSGLPIRCDLYTLSCPGFKFANFSPEIFFSYGNRLKSGLPIRYSVYTHVRDLSWPTFHLKILFQTEIVSNVDSPYDRTYILKSEI